jgi:hypothetical protein
MSESRRGNLANVIALTTGLLQEYLEAEVLSPPVLLSSGGDDAAVWACDLKLLGSSEIVRAVPIATAATETLYASVADSAGASGSAVLVHRDPRSGRMEIIGFAKRKPGTYRWIEVDTDSGVGGDVTDETLTSRYLTYAELADNGGYGVCPYDAIGIFRGEDLVEVIP